MHRDANQKILTSDFLKNLLVLNNVVKSRISLIQPQKRLMYQGFHYRIPTWFDRPEVQFKTFFLAMKTSYPLDENDNETPGISKHFFFQEMLRISQNSRFPLYLGDMVTCTGH